MVKFHHILQTSVFQHISFLGDVVLEDIVVDVFIKVLYEKQGCLKTSWELDL